MPPPRITSKTSRFCFPQTFTVRKCISEAARKPANTLEDINITMDIFKLRNSADYISFLLVNFVFHFILRANYKSSLFVLLTLLQCTGK